MPHCTLKEANSIADQLINTVDSLPPMRMIDLNDLMHIRISAWRSGQSVPQVMEDVELATRRAALQRGNNWSVGEGNTLDMGRGSVRWRTLLENTLNRGGPRLYQKPAVLLDGKVHHREILALPVNIDTLLQRPFQRWLQKLLLQCSKSQRKRFLFELADADGCQNINRLVPVFRMLAAFGYLIAVD